MSVTKNPTFNPNQRKNTLTPLGRKVALAAGALTLTGTVAGGLEAVNVPVVSGPVGAVQNGFDSIHEQHVYSQKGLGQQEMSDGKLPVGTGLLQPETITGNRIPKRVAHDLNAKDVAQVTAEISGQVGGADKLDAGDAVLLPASQLHDVHFVDINGNRVPGDSEGLRYLVPNEPPQQQ